MEALTAASVAALTLYDMAKALQRDIVIERIELLAQGGRAASRRVRRGTPGCARRIGRPSTRRWSSPARTARRPGSATTPPARSLIAALRGAGFDVAPEPLVLSPTTRARSPRPLRALADAGHRLILTTGGTGLSPTDVTPAATRRGDRPRGTRPRGADATPRAGLDAHGRPLRGRGREPGRDAHREPAGLAARRDGVAGGVAAGPAHALEQLAGGDH